MPGGQAYASFLGDPRLQGQGNAPVRAAVMRQMQRTYGNHAVQRRLSNQGQSIAQTFRQRAVQRWQAARNSRQDPTSPVTSAQPHPNSNEATPSHKGWQSDAVPVQRVILKAGTRQEYKILPLGVIARTEGLSNAEKAELKKIHKEKRRYTYENAIKTAKSNAKKSGRMVTGRSGNRINKRQDLIDHLRGLKGDTTKLEDKFNNHGPVFDKIFQSVEIMKEDFPKLPSTTSGPVYTYFISTVNQVVPSMTRTISALNDVAEDVVKIDKSVANSCKGRWFENWCLDNVIPGAKGRATFTKKGTMASDRLSDGYDPTKQELWDMKHTDGTVPTDQAKDYSEILNNGYKSKEGYKVKAVNYLFPTIDGAKANSGLATTYGFGVYYVDSAKGLTKYA